MAGIGGKRLSPIEDMKRFGITMGMGFLVIAIIVLFGNRHNPLFIFFVSFVFFVLAFLRPLILKPIYVFWIKMAFLLGWVNTRIILIVLFYTLFTPIGLVMKLFRIDLLDMAIDRNRESYWRKKEEIDPPADYRRQF